MLIYDFTKKKNFFCAQGPINQPCLEIYECLYIDLPIFYVLINHYK
jgi:hypothetical protein